MERKQIGDVPTMQKKSLLALLLVLAMMLSGCALVSVNEAKDYAQTIVDVDGETIDKLTFSNYVYALVNSNETMNLYYTYGYTDYVYQTVAQEYVQNLVMKHEAAKQGLDKLTEEEQAEVNENALKQYNEFLDAIADSYLTDSGLEGDELREAAAKYVEENGIVTILGLSTLEDYQKYLADLKPMEKLQASVTDGVTIPDESVEDSMQSEHYRLVKHILLSYTDAGSVADAQAALEAAQETAAAQANVNTPAEGADLEALNTALNDANAAVEAAQAALADAEALKAKAEEVYALATAEGADFDALISEYNDDPGAFTYTDGYFISDSYASNYVTEFSDAALALENVGDISGIVETDYGYHIIQYAADYTSESETMQEQREALQADLLSSVQSTALQAAYEEWESNAKINLYLDRLN